jgi:hypothetical protein
MLQRRIEPTTIATILPPVVECVKYSIAKRCDDCSTSGAQVQDDRFLEAAFSRKKILISKISEVPYIRWYARAQSGEPS